jgi:Kef-type K+ transport system membrane component KefB
MDTLSIVVICLGLSFILSEVFFRLKYPRIIGQIVAGLLLSLPFVKFLFNQDSLSDISFLADIGVIFLLFITGMKLNLHKFKEAKKDTFILALFSVLVPFLMGFVLMKAIDYSNVVSFVFGACISLTAEGTNLKVLIDFKALNSKVGVIMLGVGILDDLFELIFLSVVIILVHSSITEALFLPLKIILFVAVMIVTYKLFPKVLSVIQKEKSRIATLSATILFGLFMALVSTKLDIGPVIGAFVAGVILHLIDKDKADFHENLLELEALTFAFIIPFFFINIGLHFDISSFGNNLYLIIIVIVIATVSKLLGAFMAKPWTDLSWKQLHLIGWGLNSRGAIELVIAQVAFANELLPVEIYSAIVIMAIVTTIAFPVVMKYVIRNDRTILH